MAKEATYVQKGDVIDYVAGADIAVGEVIPLVTRCGVAVTAIANGATGALALEGIFQVATSDTSAAWAVGDVVYWTTATNTSSKTATGGIPLGIAAAVKGSTAAVGYVRLTDGLPLT